MVSFSNEHAMDCGAHKQDLMRYGIVRPILEFDAIANRVGHVSHSEVEEVEDRDIADMDSSPNTVSPTVKAT